MLDSNQLVQISTMKRQLINLGGAVSEQLINDCISLLDSLRVKPEYIYKEHISDHIDIRFVIEWALNIEPLSHLLSGVGKLPVSRDDNDYEGFFTRLLNDFTESISRLPDSSLIKPDIELIKKISSGLIDSVNDYLNGSPAVAFIRFQSVMKLLTSYVSLSKLFTEQKDRISLYKMRIGNDHAFTADEMFHIPFEKRGLVKTNRYSIPGLPCVYLGSTPLVCWKELGEPDLNTTQGALFQTSSSLHFLDIAMPPMAAEEFVRSTFHDGYIMHHKIADEVFKDTKTYLTVWPLIAACSIRTKNKDDAFKPEYIIPQLLLQWVRQDPYYDGVSYFSTRYDRYDSSNYLLFQNYALPVKSRNATGHCNELRSKFRKISNAIPWQSFQIHKSSNMIYGYSKKGIELELIEGLRINYRITDFGYFEMLLD